MQRLLHWISGLTKPYSKSIEITLDKKLYLCIKAIIWIYFLISVPYPKAMSPMVTELCRWRSLS